VKDYHINIFYSDEDKCYFAEIPDLFSCTAFGDTPEEALKEVQIAKELWLEVARDLGKPIPRPKYRSNGRLRTSRR
jgi:predicted RNase H-like HicB family nuclease